ncbi:MAG: spore maturation protein [Lachnospiraceae bacterium]|nr:spore maturation protein [Lachnospiraceae bacterium]
MNIISFLSNLMIPLLLFLIVGYGLANKVNIFDAFVKGAADGMKVVFGVLPTLIGLLVAIGLLRQSGFLEAVSKLLKPVAETTGFPAVLLPLALIKMVSSSAATGLLTDIFKEYGTDSYTGYLAGLLMCCSETIFYTISVYFMATKDERHHAVTDGRWMLFGALLSTFAGTAASVVLAKALT